MRDVVIAGYARSPFQPASRGELAKVRPDDLVAAVVRTLIERTGVDPEAIEDLIVGCAFPEGEQGLNVARLGVLMAGLPDTVGGVTVNRFCASGLTAIAMAADRIRVGEADVMIAAGVESMSMVPMMGNTPSMSPSIASSSGPRMAPRLMPR